MDGWLGVRVGIGKQGAAPTLEQGDWVIGQLGTAAEHWQQRADFSTPTINASQSPAPANTQPLTHWLSLAPQVSVNDFVVRAVALALRDVPAANAAWDASAQQPAALPSVDVAIAVATDTGLLTPIVRGADNKSLRDISTEVKVREGVLRLSSEEGAACHTSRQRPDLLIAQPQELRGGGGGNKRQPKVFPRFMAGSFSMQPAHPHPPTQPVSQPRIHTCARTRSSPCPLP